MLLNFYCSSFFSDKDIHFRHNGMYNPPNSFYFDLPLIIGHVFRMFDHEVNILRKSLDQTKTF